MLKGYMVRGRLRTPALDYKHRLFDNSNDVQSLACVPQAFQ